MDSYESNQLSRTRNVDCGNRLISISKNTDLSRSETIREKGKAGNAYYSKRVMITTL